jgi:hypothetical protein
MRSTIIIIKWVAPLTKLYPIPNSLIGQREHPTFRHPPKTQILREDRTFGTVVQEHGYGRQFLEKKSFLRLVPEPTKPSSVPDFLMSYFFDNREVRKQCR